MKSDSCRRWRYCKARSTCDGHSRLKVIANLSFNGSRAFGLGVASSSSSSSGGLSSSVWVRGIQKDRPIYDHVRQRARKAHLG